MKKLQTIITILLFGAVVYLWTNPQEQQTGVTVSEEEKEQFQAQIESFQTFTKAFNEEDIDLFMSVMSDSVKWSPPSYNGNEVLGAADIKLAGQGYFDSYDEITFNEGEGLVGADIAYWSGSLYSAGETNTDPSVMRVYGTWAMTHTETGAPVHNKWYAVLTFNEDGKIAVFSDWFDYGGMQGQIDNFVESNKN
jgi:ketosteroid isomerase-like protein